MVGLGLRGVVLGRGGMEFYRIKKNTNEEKFKFTVPHNSDPKLEKR